jgi:hypothetical protein
MSAPIIEMRLTDGSTVRGGIMPGEDSKFWLETDSGSDRRPSVVNTAELGELIDRLEHMRGIP